MEWNATSTYPFRYAHSQSSMQYLLKLSRLGNNAVVFALALGDDKTTSFDLPVKDYISSSALPLSQSTADLRSALPDVFISTTRLQDLIGMFKVNVIQKLAPGLHKEGYEGSNQASRAMPPPNPPIDPLREYDPLAAYNPLAANPGRPVPSGDFPPPGFEDAYDINRPPGGFLPQMGGRNPLTIGDGDLYPPGLGPHDPIRGTFGPRIGRGSGMHPTFDDPLFGGRRDEEYNPQVPPGARYDPVGPGDGPPFGRGRNAHGPGGFFGGGFGGDII
jgi:PI31 proteasome regulator N-terminal/PI31 proteasome regulator